MHQLGEPNTIVLLLGMYLMSSDVLASHLILNPCMMWIRGSIACLNATLVASMVYYSRDLSLTSALDGFQASQNLRARSPLTLKRPLLPANFRADSAATLMVLNEG